MILVCPNCTSRFKVKAEAIGGAGRTVRCAKCGHKWHATQEDLIDPSDLKSLSDASAPAKKAAAPKKARPAKAPPPKPAPEEPAFEEPVASEPPDEPDLPEEEEVAPPPPPPMMDGTEPPPLPREEDFVPRRTVPTKRRSPLMAWIVLLVFVTLGSLTAFVFRVDIVTAYLPANKIFTWAGFPVDLLGHGLVISKPEAEAIIEDDSRRLVIKGTIENNTDETIAIPKMAASLLDASGLELEVWIFDADKTEAFPGESVSYLTEFDNPPRGATNISITFKTEEEAMMIESGEAPPSEGTESQ